MDNTLDGLESQVKKTRDFDAPPLHLWNPPLSGDIDIVIDREGEWHHEGTRIERDALVRLFASILRREEDGEYYLVTPAEKWRISVELHPLMVVEVVEDDSGKLLATLNTGKEVAIDTEHPLFLEPSVGDIAAVRLSHGLTALFTRAAWYRLVDQANESEGHTLITSGDYSFDLSPG